ncbi:MMPL family transporter [Protaetiibacter sp. SSC-01]|uniref:MMPL family transporter n=1 Tax=Protaetiibacter sp. SSC-01 TaxID=2759943 RepID=UPI001656CBC1|nr:MMPL family transporter [Protaetiibacter sp. SSC-01]QNO37675.1 MMPL family transporter [Protaetiibacter sp. SSC-01]
MAELLYRLGRLAARRAGWVIGVWALVLALTAGAFAAFFGGLSNSFDIPGTASSEVIDELQERLPEYSGAAGMVVFHTDDGSQLTDAQRTAISQLAADTSDLVDVAEVVDPFDAEQQRADQLAQVEAGRAQLDEARAQLDGGQAQLDAGRAQLDAARAQLEASGAPPAMLAGLDAQRAELDAQQATLDAGRAELEAQATLLEQGARVAELAEGIRVVSEDGATAVVNVAFTEPRLELSDEAKQSVIDHFSDHGIDGVEVAFSTEIAQGVPAIIGVSEAIGVAIAGIVLVVMLGSLLAASFPIVTALTGVAIGVLGALAFSGLTTMASVTPVLGVMLGLAVGIDYSLFIVNRHRRQLLSGAEVHESIALANGTAGTAVVFAGSTVVVALLALFVTGIPFLGLMGAVGAACVAIAVAVAVTLTPAMLGLAGERMLGRRGRRTLASGPVPHPADTATPMGWVRTVVTIVLTVAALLACAVPAASMRLGLPDGGSEPEGSTTNRAFELLHDGFGAGANSTMLVTAQLPDGTTDDEVLGRQLDIAEAIGAVDGVVAVAPIAVDDANELLAFQVIPAEGPNDASTAEVVHALRGLEVDGELLGVAGQAAINIDISNNLADVLPLYLAVVVGISLVIMILVFRSLLVPLIATGGFILSLLATYGALVAVFQWGWFAPVFGLTATGPVLSFMPLILVGILFGLAMDYQLFLASGMREAYVHGATARLAVARGFRAGRSVVIAAGLIMVSVFGGFVFSEAVIIRQFGFGLAVGVLLDAFVVRLLLMPALMHVLGRAAWWIPRWLDRAMPNVDVEGAALERAHQRA